MHDRSHLARKPAAVQTGAGRVPTRTLPPLFVTLVLAVGSIAAAPASAQQRLELSSPWLDAAPVAIDAGDSRPFDLEALSPGEPRSVRAVTSADSSGGGGISGPSRGGNVQPAGTQFGLGLQLGIPTGVTAKLMFGGNVGIVVGLGFGVGWVVGPALSVHTDVVWHPFVLLQSQSFQFSWSVGGGAWLGFNPLEAVARADLFGRARLLLRLELPGHLRDPYYGLSGGLRLPLGLSLSLNSLPIEVYGDIVPALLLVPALGAGLGADVGIRIYL
jgi:hypothetical protein